MLRSKPAVPKRSALDAALGLLARRDHSTLELRRKLQRAGHPVEDIETALLSVREQGYLDDQRFAGSLTRSLTDRGRGPRAISAKLSQAGVKAAPRDEADESTPTDWLVQARAALERRYGEEAPTDAAEWAKRARWLLGRGFTETQIRPALGPQPPAPRGEFKKSGLRSR